MAVPKKRQRNSEKHMKTIFIAIKALGILAIAALIAGCVSTHSRENALTASGFKIITPNTPQQEAKLQALPADKVTMIHRGGKIYYAFPDVARHRIYVGGPKQLQAYKELREQQKIADENLEASQMNEDNSMDWDNWNGWRAWGMGYNP
jgi:hypothetical protein